MHKEDFTDKTDKLYRLISTLDKSEKGFVKKFAALHIGEDANSLRLFDIYNNLKEYNKNKIEKLVQKEKFAAYFAKTKNYLYEVILRALRVYHNDKEDWNRIRTMILDADLLRKKRLHSEALSLVKKIKKEAINKEWYSILMDAISLEGNMVQTFDTSSEQYMEKMHALHAERLEYRKMDDARQLYNDCMRYLFELLCRIHKEKRKVLIEEANEIILTEKFKSFENYKGCRLELYRSFSLYQFHYLTENKKAFHEEGLYNIQLLNKKLTRDAFHTKTIIGYYANLGSLSIIINDVVLYEKCLEHIDEIVAHLDKGDNDNFVHGKNSSYKIQCEYHFHQKNFEKGLDIIVNKWTTKLEADNAIDGNNASIYFYHSVFLFFAQKFEESIKITNSIDLFSEQQTVIHNEHYVVKILCHLELGNIESDIYLAKKHLHYIKQQGLLFEQRKTLLQLLIKHSPNKKELVKMFLNEVESKKIEEDNSVEISMISLLEWAQK